MHIVSDISYKKIWQCRGHCIWSYEYVFTCPFVYYIPRAKI